MAEVVFIVASGNRREVEAPEGALPGSPPDESEGPEFMAKEPRENSRLPSQIIVTNAMEGAVFEVGTGHQARGSSRISD